MRWSVGASAPISLQSPARICSAAAAGLLGLAALGVWARIYLNWRMSTTFGTKLRAFGPGNEATRLRLRQLIAEKRELLGKIDPLAVEGTFSITLAHRMRTPMLALSYDRLVREESKSPGARQSVGFQQAYWRIVHLLLAYIFIAGIVIHVVTVTFFAGYVAAGGPIAWWHLTKW